MDQLSFDETDLIRTGSFSKSVCVDFSIVANSDRSKSLTSDLNSSSEYSESLFGVYTFIRTSR